MDPKSLGMILGQIRVICYNSFISTIFLEKLIMIEIKKAISYQKLFHFILKRKMARIFLLGIIQGFPFVLIYSALSLWLRDNDFSRSQIGFLSLIGLVYGFNWLWAPIIDRIRIPWLTNKIGHRKSWIVVMQSIIFFSLIVWGLSDPKESIWIVGLVGLNYCNLLHPHKIL